MSKHTQTVCQLSSAVTHRECKERLRVEETLYVCACLVHQVTGMCLCGQQCSEQQDLAEIFLWREAIASRDLTEWKENKSLKQDILRGKPEWDVDAGEIFFTKNWFTVSVLMKSFVMMRWRIRQEFITCSVTIDEILGGNKLRKGKRSFFVHPAERLSGRWSSHLKWPWFDFMGKLLFVKNVKIFEHFAGILHGRKHVSRRNAVSKYIQWCVKVLTPSSFLIILYVCHT